MKLKVYYESISPYYSSHSQVFIGVDEESCYRQKDEYEKWLGRDLRNCSISYIYKVIVSSKL